VDTSRLEIIGILCYDKHRNSHLRQTYYVMNL